MRNITLSAEESLIKEAREKARKQNTTLNALFRDWLEDFTGRRDRGKEYREMMKRFSHIRVDRKFTREELNSRD